MRRSPCRVEIPHPSRTASPASGAALSRPTRHLHTSIRQMRRLNGEILHTPVEDEHNFYGPALRVSFVMIVQHHNRPGRLLGTALVLICFCVLVPVAAAANIATGSFQVSSVGETVSVPIVLDTAPGGISGYRVVVSLSNPSVATITSVAFPDWASLKSSSAVPSGRVVLQSVDLSQQVPMGGASVLLATLTVRGTATGSTSIVVTPDSSMGVQDRNGNLYAVSSSAGSLSVAGGSSGGAPTPVPPVVIPTTVPPVVNPTAAPPIGGPTTVVTVPPVVIPIDTVQTLPIGTDITRVTTVPTTAPWYTVTPLPTGGSFPPDVVPTVFPVAPVTIDSPSEVSVPTVIVPGAQPTFSFGKRYAIGNPGSYIGTRFGSGGTSYDTSGPIAVTGPQATLKPGSRAYGITPPAGRFIRWYPAARWQAGIR